MRRRELTAGRAMSIGLALAMLAGYLVAPNAAMGGDEVKIRLAWLAVVFGVASVMGILSMRRLAAGITVYACVVTVLALQPVRASNVRAVGAVTGEARRVLARIPAGRTAVRLRFPTDRFRVGAGYDGVALEPLLHVESRSAAEGEWVNLTDYQAAAGIFPVVFGKRFEPWHRYELWGLEGATGEAMKTLDVLWCTLPVEVDYVIVIGDREDEGRRKVAGEIESRGRYRLAAADGAGAFLWLYERVEGVRGCAK